MSEQIADISQTTFSNTFYRMKSILYLIRFYLSVSWRVLIPESGVATVTVFNP